MTDDEENNKSYTPPITEIQTQTPDSTTVICESLVSKLKEKDDEDKPKAKKSKKLKRYRTSDKHASDHSTESEDSDKADEESDWSSAPNSPAPLKAPRAFEKSDHLYQQKKEKTGGEPIPDWSWESEESQPDDCVILTDTVITPKP